MVLETEAVQAKKTARGRTHDHRGVVRLKALRWKSCATTTIVV